MSELINLLMVEDSEHDAILLAYELRKADFELNLQRVQTAQEMQAALAAKNWDAVISDYNLPAFSAPKALEILRRSGKDLPFIVVSGTIGEQTAVEIMRSGAHDYLMKENLNRLAEVLRREIRDARGRVESRLAEIALKTSEEQLRLLFERSNDAIFVVEKRTGRYLDANQAAERLTGRTVQELKTLTVADVTPRGADGRLQKISFVGAPMDFDQVNYVGPTGITRTAHLTVLPIDEMRVFGIAHDITEQILAENALRQRAQELEVLYRTSLEINSQIDLLPLLQTIVERAANLLNAPMGGLYLLRSDNSETFELVVSHNLPGNFIGATLRVGEGLSGLIAQTGQAIMVDDYRTWQNRAAVYDASPFRRVLGVPMRVKGQVIGIINISDDEITGPYSPEEIRLASLFADQAAIAMENARLLNALQSELTERKQAELSLRESEERYRIVVTRAPLISFVFDRNGIFTLSEGRGLDTLGLKPGQVVGQSVFDVYRLYPEIIEDVRAALSGETRRQDAKVGANIFETYYIPIFDEAGNVSHVIGVANDVSERKQAEENLRSTQVFLDHVLKAIPLGISVFNTLTLKVEFENVVSMTLRGMSMAEFNAMPNSERMTLIHPDDRDQRIEFMKGLATLADGETRTIEYRRIGQAGSSVWRWFRYRYFVFERDASGGVTKILSVSEDVSGSKQAEQALQRQLRELTILHNIARAGIQVNTVDELVELVTQEVGNSFYTENFGLLLIDRNLGVLRAHPSYRGLMEGVDALAPLEKSITGQVLTTGKPRRIADVQVEPYYVEVTAGIRSELCVPIKTGEDTFGVINAESKQVDFFSDEDERLLLTIAGQLANSIERLRLFIAERERRQEAENLRQATAALSTSLDLDHVLESILTSLKQVVPYDSASVFLLEGDHLLIKMVAGIENTADLLGSMYPADDLLFQEIKVCRLPIILIDASADPRFKGWGATSPIRGWMGVPLITRGEVIGYITLDNYQVAAYSQESGIMAQAFTHQAAAAIENARLFKETQSSLAELNQAYESTIEGWSKAMDLRDKETEGHTLRVTKMTTQLAQVMGIEPDQLVHIRRGALLHDIGKMGVPDRILLKPDSLSDDEMRIMRRHPRYAYDMLSMIAYLLPALDIPYCHHERWDGNGYPRGLKDRQIPLAARLFAVVDVWDALTSDRPYRPAWTPTEALEYIKNLSGLQFDPEIVEKFVEMIGKEKNDGIHQKN